MYYNKIAEVTGDKKSVVGYLSVVFAHKANTDVVINDQLIFGHYCIIFILLYIINSKLSY